MAFLCIGVLHFALRRSAEITHATERESSRGCSNSSSSSSNGNRNNSIPASKIHIKYEFIRRKICAYVLYVCCVYATLAAIYAYIFPRRIRIHIPCCLLHTCIFVYVLLFTFFCTLRIWAKFVRREREREKEGVHWPTDWLIAVPAAQGTKNV